MKNFFDQIEGLLNFESLSLKVLIVVIAAALLRLFMGYFLNHAKKASKLTSNLWDDSLVKAARAPLVTLLWVIALRFIADIIIKSYYVEALPLLNILTKIAVNLCFAWFLLRLINHFAQALIESKKLAGDSFDHTTIDALSKLCRLVVIIFTILAVMQNLGFSVSGILAAGGAGGLIVGFAAKDLFANFFGGLTIYLDRPFSVGDWIRCSEKDIEGTVEYIGWRHTRIRAFNANPLYVPNSVFTTVVVENPSRMTNRRIKEFIGLRYCDITKMNKITQDVVEMVENHPEIDQNRTKIINFDKFSASSVDFMVYIFAKTTNWQKFTAVKQDVLLKIAEIIENNGAEIAFPTRTLHVENDQTEFS